jgi:DHA3 family macrolide efflux protein-like MFS transporter
MTCTGIAAFHLLIVAAVPFYANLYFAIATIVVLAAMLGLTISIANMFLSVETYHIIEREYLARASSIGGALASAMMPVIAFIVSGALQFVGVPTIFISAGIIAVAFCGVLFFNSALNDEPQLEENESSEAA